MLDKKVVCLKEKRRSRNDHQVVFYKKCLYRVSVKYEPKIKHPEYFLREISWVLLFKTFAYVLSKGSCAFLKGSV